MELFAAIAGLEFLKDSWEVVVVSDSRYLVDNAKRIPTWSRRGLRLAIGDGQLKNVDLWKRLSVQIERHRVRFDWTRGHAGNAANELADAVAGQMAGAPRSIDIGYERTVPYPGGR